MVLARHQNAFTSRTKYDLDLIHIVVSRCIVNIVLYRFPLESRIERRNASHNTLRIYCGRVTSSIRVDSTTLLHTSQLHPGRRVLPAVAFSRVQISGQIHDHVLMNEFFPRPPPTRERHFPKEQAHLHTKVAVLLAARNAPTLPAVPI